MPTLALVLSGVLQSWGTTTIGHARATNAYPTKSAVIGLIANALGRDRMDNIADLATLSYGVRVDSPGIVQRDYHTVSIITQPTKGDRINRVTERFYLADAVFLVTLNHSDEKLVNSIADALKKPSRALFLGRKSCPPNRPIFHSVSDSSLESVLSETSWQVDNATKNAYKDSTVTLDIFRDPVDSQEALDADPVSDQPVSFNPDARRYASRAVHQTSTTIPVDSPAEPDVLLPPMMLLAMRAAGAVA